MWNVSDSDTPTLLLEYVYNPLLSGNNANWLEIDINEAYFDAIENYVFWQVSKIDRDMSDLQKNNFRVEYINSIRSANTKIKGVKNTLQLARQREQNIK